VVLRENGFDPKLVTAVAICSVVPAALYSLRGAAEKYFHCEPFVLQAGVKTGLKIKYRNPAEVGADRIAAAIGAVHRHPKENLLVVDMGTATTLEVITATGDYLGGAILPGVGMSAETLASHTAKLPRVEIARPEAALGRSSVESIQSGLYHGHVGAVRHLISLVAIEAFHATKPLVIGTGGFARMFEAEGLFNEVVPELVLNGLRDAHALNYDLGK
jgi:type III pantothenate kinase